MKRMILFFLAILIVPFFFCIGFRILHPEVEIGAGGGTLEEHYMGRDVLLELNGLYKSIDVEEYVTGVMAGVIPADYHMEALKTQAVLVRTNVLKEMEEKNTRDDADLPYHYLTKEERQELWGRQQYEKLEERLEQAVVATAGRVLRKEGSLIMALYHEVSIGKTASASEILDEDISYLQSVESSQDVEAKNYMNLIHYTWEELAGKAAKDDRAEAGEGDAQRQTLIFQGEGQNAGSGGDSGRIQGVEGDDVVNAVQDMESGDDTNETKDMEADDGQESGENMEAGGGQEGGENTEAGGDQQSIVHRAAVSVEESTENGFVKRVSVDGSIYSGQEAMELFDLPSMNFYVEEMEDGIRFVCLGKGNCLGVSQYGANYMASKGSSMEDILSYYYRDVNLEEAYPR